MDKNIIVAQDTLGSVRVQFDWRPGVEDDRATFTAKVERAEQTSAIAFELDLRKLARAELGRLQNFLARRHAGRTQPDEVAAILSWLLDCSIKQTQPTLERYEREALVRQLLLAQGTGHRERKQYERE